jgi:hypothetical protein
MMSCTIISRYGERMFIYWPDVSICVLTDPHGGKEIIAAVEVDHYVKKFLQSPNSVFSRREHDQMV